MEGVLRGFLELDHDALSTDISLLARQQGLTHNNLLVFGYVT